MELIELISTSERELTMGKIWNFVKALLRHWWQLMSCAAFTLLALYSAKTNQPNERVAEALVAIAIVCFVAAAYGAWSDEHDKLTQLEGQARLHAPSFQFEVGATIWIYNAEADLTMFFTLASILNKGHRSVTLGWQAIYKIGESAEPMTSFYLRGPQVVNLGAEQITFQNDDLLNVKTAEVAIERGCVTNGRLLFTVKGDRRAELKTLQYKVEFTCRDYQGTPYTAVYTPSSVPVSTLLTHAHEKASLIIAQKALIEPQTAQPENKVL